MQNYYDYAPSYQTAQQVPQQGYSPYAPLTALDQYSRVGSMTDIKSADAAEFAASRHSVSMSQPDLSSATWGDEAKYQVL